MTPLKVVLASGVLNCIGDFVLCHVFGMGLLGAAVATVAAEFFLFGAMLAQVCVWAQELREPVLCLPACACFVESNPRGTHLVSCPGLQMDPQDHGSIALECFHLRII